MLTKIGHSLLETVEKEPEIGDKWGDATIIEVYETEPLVYELVLDTGYSVFVSLE
jgi:hypothetical protein